MRLLNLFDGIGGFALAAEWMGWDNVASCEIDPFCRRVLDYHFKYRYIYADIRQADFTGLRGKIDIITGGFPCQPFSLAGKQRGTDDDRYLFPEMLRAVREVQPRWVVAENVRGLITQQGGLVFEQVCSSMESLGYEVQPFILPACAVNAPHRRDRVWIVAHRADAGVERVQGREKEILSAIDASNSERGDIQMRADKGIQPEEPRGEKSCNACGKRDATNPESAGLQGGFEKQRKEESWRRYSRIIPVGFDRFPTQSPVCSGDDGVSSWLDGITFPKWREQSIKAFGNAVVPQVVYQIFRTIDYYERRNNQ